MQSYITGKAARYKPERTGNQKLPNSFWVTVQHNKRKRKHTCYHLRVLSRQPQHTGTFVWPVLFHSPRLDQGELSEIPTKKNLELCIFQCFESGFMILEGCSILGWIPIRIWIQVLMTKMVFFDRKLQFTYPQASIKDVQATGEAFSPQKRPSSTSKHEISKLFSVLWVIFSSWIQIRNSDPEFGSGFTDLIESGSNYICFIEFFLVYSKIYHQLTIYV